jgi:hypothetical protein
MLRACYICWLHGIPLQSYLITRTNSIHFTITFTLLKFKASTCFGHHLSILRRHYTNTVLVGVACCCRCSLFTGYGKTADCHLQSNLTPWTTYISNSTLHPPKLCSCSASWGWASDARNMSRLWVLIKWKWLWSVSSWCVLLNYIMI